MWQGENPSTHLAVARDLVESRKNVSEAGWVGVREGWTEPVAGPTRHTSVPMPGAAGKTLRPGMSQLIKVNQPTYFVHREPRNYAISKHLTLKCPTNFLTDSPSRESSKGWPRVRINVCPVRLRSARAMAICSALEADDTLINAAVNTGPFISTTFATM